MRACVRACVCFHLALAVCVDVELAQRGFNNSAAVDELKATTFLTPIAPPQRQCLCTHKKKPMYEEPMYDTQNMR